MSSQGLGISALTTTGFPAAPLGDCKVVTLFRKQKKPKDEPNNASRIYVSIPNPQTPRCPVEVLSIL